MSLIYILKEYKHYKEKKKKVDLSRNRLNAVLERSKNDRTNVKVRINSRLQDFEHKIEELKSKSIVLRILILLGY